MAERPPVKRRRSDVAVEADIMFELYYALGPERSLANVHARAGELGVKTPRLKTIEGWSARYGWQARVQARDDRARELTEERKALEISRMDERQSFLGAALQNVAGEALSALRMRAKNEPLSATDITALVREGVKTERTARGAATERHEIIIDVWTTVIHEMVVLFQRVNVLDDPDVRTSEFADGVDSIAQQHVATLALKG